MVVCAQTTIVRHQQSSLVPLMFISDYRQHVSITLQCAQTIASFQQAPALGQGSSSLPHIIVIALLSLTDLW
jgi:hypothetical protein